MFHSHWQEPCAAVVAAARLLLPVTIHVVNREAAGVVGVAEEGAETEGAELLGRGQFAPAEVVAAVVEVLAVVGVLALAAMEAAVAAAMKKGMVSASAKVHPLTALASPLPTFN